MRPAAEGVAEGGPHHGGEAARRRPLKIKVNKCPQESYFQTKRNLLQSSEKSCTTTMLWLPPRRACAHRLYASGEPRKQRAS